MSLNALARAGTLTSHLRLGPTEAAVVLHNGRPIQVRRSGKYGRWVGKGRLPLTGELGAIFFHVGQLPVD
ncbi:MAG: hypothetical protein KDB08_11550, partial [Microthrixaceae bacterium]|nr:hypothetical protein [Microthrixaceae bacterium]